MISDDQLEVKSKQHAATVIVTAIAMNAVADFKCLADAAEETPKPELPPDAACIVSPRWIAADGRANESVSATSVIRHQKKKRKKEIA